MNTDSPMSAFAIYSANRKPKKNKKNKKKAKNEKKKIPQSSAKPGGNISEDVQIHVAKNIKKQQEKSKETKTIGKKKPIEKSRTKTHKSKKAERILFKNKKISKASESDEEPILKRVRNQPEVEEIQEIELSSSECSSLSEGSIEFTPVQTDSAEEALKVFQWMIAPFDPQEFFQQVWEKKPLHISRKKPNYYKDLISTPTIDHMLRNENIQFTKNLDVTSYIDGKRETHNPEGRAHPHLVWDYYLNGCSVRLLNPQTYIPKLHILNATLQEHFNCFVGANSYLTPPDSQGFAPHYDDIEAFILQAEGKKLWRVYKPPKEEVLPRVSSKNFNQDEIGEPVLQVTLEAGDMLYFPRGYIHQGVTIDGEHSLHVTISMYQKHSWADLFEKLIPAALHIAVSENVELRRGLPFGIYDHFGLVHSDSQTPRREEIKDMVLSLFDTLKDYLPIDDSVDQMHKNYQKNALPPVLNDSEKEVTVYGSSDLMVENGKVVNRVEIELDTKIRLLRKNILRMVLEDKLKVYYYVENSMEYDGSEVPYLEIEEDIAKGIEDLITAYPGYVSVESLSIEDGIKKVQLADALWSRGLIMSEYPLMIVDD